MSGRNVSLTEHLSFFVDGPQQLQNESEVVREALRHYEDSIAIERERLEAIRRVIRDGREVIARGECTPVATPDDAGALHSRHTRTPWTSNWHALPRRPPQPVVMSDRDCGGTPDPKTTVALLRRMHALDAVILKIAVMPSDAGDV
jgi:antitoxin ParD1/3/4